MDPSNMSTAAHCACIAERIPAALCTRVYLCTCNPLAPQWSRRRPRQTPEQEEDGNVMMVSDDDERSDGTPGAKRHLVEAAAHPASYSLRPTKRARNVPAPTVRVGLDHSWLQNSALIPQQTPWPGGGSIGS